MEGYNKFYGYLSDLAKSCDKLSGLLLEKLAALEKYDIEALEKIIKEEQAYVLVTRGFDSSIESYRQKLSLSGEKLSDIVSGLPDGEIQRFRDMHRKLSASLEKVKGLNDKCQELIEERLYTLDKTIKGLTGSGTAYGKTGDPASPGNADPHILTRSV